MEYMFEQWDINQLISLYKNGEINLSPPYQRNYIWSINDQRLLIETIVNEQPLPSFFILKKAENEYEMVDGQQRCRSILAFIKKDLLTKQGSSIDDFPEFKNYILNMTVITYLSEGESIEKFYALVNKSGKKLNKPELDKAEYYDTKFLALLNKLSDSESFLKLKLFRSTNRMNDIDMISELVALIKFGISDKKDKVNYLYENDISCSEATIIEETFNKVINILNIWDESFPFCKTRYKQKNDLYTIFSLIIDNLERKELLIAVYEWLQVFDEHIYPSNEKCWPFKEYAVNCVTQSNSKKAREKRLELLKEMLFPSKNEGVTNAINNYFGIDESNIVEINGEKIYNTEIIVTEE